MKLMIAATLAASAVLAAPAALAHSRQVSSSPAAASTVRSAPTELRLQFSERVLPRFVSVEVTAPGGQSLHVETPTLTPGDERTVRAEVHGAGAPGVYQVRWSAAGPDMHRMTGAFSFTVRP